MSSISAALRALEPFVGEWDTTGTILAEDGRPEGRLVATDIYEWFDGGFFMLHHVDGRMGDIDVKALEVIGSAPGADKVLAHSFDNSGQADHYEASLDGRRWTIDGRAQRFRGDFAGNFAVLEGQWERREDEQSSWRPWMRIRLVKR